MRAILPSRQKRTAAAAGCPVRPPPLSRLKTELVIRTTAADMSAVARRGRDHGTCGIPHHLTRRVQSSEISLRLPLTREFDPKLQGAVVVSGQSSRVWRGVRAAYWRACLMLPLRMVGHAWAPLDLPLTGTCFGIAMDVSGGE